MNDDNSEKYVDQWIDRTAMGSAERKRFKILFQQDNINNYYIKNKKISTRLHRNKKRDQEVTVPSEPTYTQRA